MGEHKQDTARYMLVQGLDWAAFAMIWVYIVVILRSYGMSYRQAGAVTALSNILAVVFQQRISAWADRAAGGSCRRSAMGLMALGTAMALVLLFMRPEQRWVIGGCFCMIGVTIMGVQPFLNTLAMERVQRGSALNYGLARGVGSVCYALVSVSAGRILNRFGNAGLLTAFIGLNLAGICAVAMFSGREETVSEIRGETLGMIDLLKKHRAFRWFLVVSVLLYTAHMLTATYMEAIVLRAGGSASDLGLVVAVGAGAEMPAMSLLQKIRGHFSTKGILLCSAAAFLAVMLCLSGAVSMKWVYLTRLLQFAEYGIFTPMSVYYVSEMIDPPNQTKGQAMCSGASTVGAVLGNYLGGVLIDFSGVRATMLFGAGLAAAGLLLLTRCFQKAAGGPDEIIT